MFEQEKMDWLKSIRAVKLPEPFLYIYSIPEIEKYYLLSEREIREKSVEGLQNLIDEEKRRLKPDYEGEDEGDASARVRDTFAY